MMTRILAALLAFVALPASAQIVVGPLQSQNKLSEIAAGGPTYQAAAQTNLGLSTWILPQLASPGPIGSVTPNTGAFTTLSATGAVSGAGFTARFASPGPIGSTTPSTATFTTLTTNTLLHMAQPASIQFDGSRTWSGTQGAIGNAEIYSFTNQSGSTSTGNPVAFHYLGIASDTLVASALKAVDVLRVDLTTGNGFSGPRNGIGVNLTIGGTTIDSSGQYSAGQFAAQANAAAPAGGSTVFGSNPTAGLSAGATGIWRAVGEEVDVRAVAGTTPEMLTGLTVVLVGGHASAGSLGLDSAISFGNSAGVSGGWDYGIRFNGPSNLAPFKSTSTLIYAYPGTGALTVANGIDLSQMTFTGAFLKSTGFSVDGSGNETAPSIGNGASAFKISGSGQWTANGSVATTMTSLGPTGSHTTIQEWLTFSDAGGTVRYIPAY